MLRLRGPTQEFNIGIIITSKYIQREDGLYMEGKALGTYMHTYKQDNSRHQ